MSEVPDKVARAKDLIEQKKRELAENIKKVRLIQKNEEIKKKEREKEIEKKKKEIQKIKEEKGIVSKPKLTEAVVAPKVLKDEAEILNSVYISDFESESGSELIERRLADPHILEPKVPVRRGYFPVPEEPEEFEVSWKKPAKEPGIESLETDAHDRQGEEALSSGIIRSSKDSGHKAKAKEQVKPSLAPEYKQRLTWEHKEPEQKTRKPSGDKPENKKPRLLEVLSKGIDKDRAVQGDREDSKYEQLKEFYFQVQTLMETEGYTSLIRLKKPPAKTLATPSVTIHPPKPSENFLDEFSTPSFSEQEPYGKFETFGKVKQILTPAYTEEEEQEREEVEQEEEVEEDEGQPEMIYIENDNERVTNLKMKKLEDRRVKRIEELEKRVVKKTLTPEKMVKLGIKIGNSPGPSPKPSPRPSLKVEMRNSPKPIHKNREELKSVGDKYKRHKNLPNLVYNKPSNRKIIKNAISQLCLAGEPNKSHREEVLNLIERLPEVNYFIIVFSDSIRRDVRGLYSHDPNTSEVSKVFGPGYLPDFLDSTFITLFFRYDSGAKEFKPLQCKDFIAATDAVCLKKIHKVYENN